MTPDEIIAAEGRYIAPTYVRPPVVFTHGSGATLYDSDGRAYLDLTAGIAVNALGHADPEWVAAVAGQAGRLVHVSNLYHTVPQVELAQKLCEQSFADRLFFSNSGAEANEAALKFARKYARRHGRQGKTKIVACSGSFHGRTMGALAATYKPHYREPFAPLVPDVTFVPFNDVAAAQAAIDEDTCAVIVEPVQGEGGINPATDAFLRALRRACNDDDVLLIFDEIQCGLGRTGTLWAHERYDVTPEIMTLAKPLAGGLPIGATLITEAIAAVLQPGDHGSTFAGGPLVCAAANVVFDRVADPAFLDEVRDKGMYLMKRLAQLPGEPFVDVRGRGLFVGLEMAEPVAPLIAAARDRGLLIINAGTHVIRLCPPLTISRAELDAALQVLADCLATAVVAGETHA